MTILVTGAGGFVGRALCRELRERDFDVRAAVRDAGRAGDLGCDVVCVPDLAARDAWAGHMLAAIDEVGFAEPVRGALREYFERAATFMINQQGNPGIELIG